MKWPKFGAYDLYAVIVIIILNFFLLTNWEVFECQSPIHWWLLVDYNLMFITRIIYVMKASGYSRQAKLILNILLFGVQLPALICWSSFGIMWHDDAVCIPDAMVPWSYFLWLFFTVLTSVLLFFKMIMDWRKYRKLKRYISKMDENEFYNQTINVTTVNFM